MVSRILLILFLLISGLSDVTAGENIRIGMSLSLSGKYTDMGNMQKRGIWLWQSHVNKAGGILGRNVELTIIDDQSMPEMARRIYRDLIEHRKMDLVIGPYSSGITEAILPVTEKNKYPVLLSGASADRLWEKGYQYAFGVYTPASKYTVGFLQMLVKYQIKIIAVLSADDTFSISLAQATRKWAKRFRLNTVYYQVFEKGTRELSEFAKAVKLSGAHAVIVCGHLNESVDMRRAMKKIQWFPKAYYASVGPATPKFHTILKHAANLTFSSSQWEKKVGVNFPQGRKFIDGFNALFDMEPSYHAATAYAAGMILETALKKIGTLDRERLRTELSRLDTMTVIGRYGVDNKGKQKRHFPLIIQWQNDQKKVVWPDTLKIADPIFE